MGKHWGLQYQNRLRTFVDAFASTRCEMSEADWKVRCCVLALADAKTERGEVDRRNYANERAVAVLMDLGPRGLARIEGEHGPELGVEEFLVVVDREKLDCRVSGQGGRLPAAAGRTEDAE